MKSNIFFYLLLIYFYLTLTKDSFPFLKQINSFSEIKMTIKGNGTQTILSNKEITIDSVVHQFSSVPSEILINGVQSNKIDFKVYNLEMEENLITLRWNYTFSYCGAMFYNLTNITKLDLSNFDSSQITCANRMFAFLSSLTSLILSNFNTNLILDMQAMFFGISSIETLNLTSFDTSSVTNMYGMFQNCNSLKWVDLSSFNTTSVKTMNGMFFKCYSLISLDLNNFDVSQVTDMYAMFAYCYSLEFLNISNFYTNSVTSFHALFYNCLSLTSLDLIHFYTSLVSNMNAMFYNCSLLQSLDLSSFDTSSATSMKGMFYNLSSLISLDLSNFNTSLVKDMSLMFFKCTSLISLNLNNFNTSSVEKAEKIFNDCNHNLVYCINNKNNESNNIIDLLTNYSFHNNCSYLCISESKKYILEKSKCIINCYDDDFFKFEFNNFCYESCPNGTNISYNSQYLCQIKNESQELINSYSDISTYDEFMNNNTYVTFFNNNLISNLSEGFNFSFLNDIYYFDNLCKMKDNLTKDDIIQNIRNELKNNTLDLLILKYIKNKHKDLISYQNNIIYQITSTFNQINNHYDNISSINLSYCEAKIRNFYNINNNITLLIFKVDIIKEGYLIPIVEYEIYNSETKEKLNLTICNRIKIDIFIPINIDEKNLFKYNHSSDFYNDICYPYTTKKNTDINLNDRRNEFNKNNMSLCEKDCDLAEYDFNTKKVKCECYIKLNFLFVSEILINVDKFKKLLLLKNNININVIKCYKILFSKLGLMKNIGNYILLFIILINILLVLIFKLYGLKKFITMVNKIIELINKNNKKIEKNIRKIKKRNNTNKAKIENNIEKNSENKSSFQLVKRKKKSKKRNSTNNILFRYNTIKNNNNNSTKNLIKYNDSEINNLTYEKALKVDKRNFFQFYFSLLKMKHLLIFTFYTYTDYNSRIIKISLFLFSFGLYLTINTLFFNDPTIHKIYEDQGSFNFIYQLPKIFYSTIISSLINLIVKFLSLSEKNILKIKEENKSVIPTKIVRLLNIKFILFFIIDFLFLLIFWYYLACFCAVYKNTQIHVIKDTILSFGLDLVYPFIINLIPSAIRIYSLKSSKKDKLCLYKVSQIIQLL